MTEDELLQKGFKKITARYNGTCSYCRQRYAAGEEIYWKSPPTTVCCPRCYSGQQQNPSVQHIQAQCSQCEHIFNIPKF